LTIFNGFGCFICFGGFGGFGGLGVLVIFNSLNLIFLALHLEPNITSVILVIFVLSNYEEYPP
jgi:hypothetical protein